MSEFTVPESLVEHARRFYAEGGVPAPPRVAATVLLLRPAAPPRAPAGPAGHRLRGDFEVYVIRRVATMAFGGMYAFPGGRVDPSDSQVHLDWSGPSSQEWGERLGLASGPAQAVVCAAAREVFEEVGVLLAGPDDAAVVGDVSDDSWESARQALVARERTGPTSTGSGASQPAPGADTAPVEADAAPAQAGFAGLLRERGLTFRSDLLLPWSRWITPEFEPRRFDTYFFVALLPQGQRTRDVSGEADHTMWIRPADALARAAAGEIAMLPPTMMTLGDVAACPDLAGVLAAAAQRDVTEPITPRLAWTADGGARFVLN